MSPEVSNSQECSLRQIGGYVRAGLDLGFATAPGYNPGGLASGCISIHDLTAAERALLPLGARWLIVTSGVPRHNR